MSIIELALTTEDRAVPVDLSFLLDKIRAALRADLEGTNYQLSWQQLMFGADIARDDGMPQTNRELARRRIY